MRLASSGKNAVTTGSAIAFRNLAFIGATSHREHIRIAERLVGKRGECVMVAA